MDKKECEPIGFAFYGVKRGTPVGNAGRKVVEEPKKDESADPEDLLMRHARHDVVPGHPGLVRR